MHFEINVSRNGKHFFATAERSCMNESETLEVYDKLRAAFPEPEYKVTVTFYTGSGEDQTKGFENLRRDKLRSQCPDCV